MKITKTVEIPAHTKEVADHTVCDFCKKRVPREGNYEVAEIEITSNFGSCTPDGGWGTCTEFDCCKACWADKVLPALHALGAKPKTYDY